MLAGKQLLLPAQGLCSSHFTSAPQLPLTHSLLLWDRDDLPKDKEDKVRAAAWPRFAQPRPSPRL